MAVSVLFFAASRDLAGTDRVELTHDPTMTLQSVRQQVLARCPALSPHVRSLLWAVNNQYVKMDHPVRDGETIACFPPVSGG